MSHDVWRIGVDQFLGLRVISRVIDVSLASDILAMENDIEATIYGSETELVLFSSSDGGW